ncbi:hypothetical protein [Sorangium sp. So ce693]|uniref:hypothetical protein n=1 Tax=Sorangium sp. So ce693 TaxID=3133318 RepID=UPI003F5F4E48
MSASVLSRLLRAPSEVAASCREDRDIRAIALASLGAIALGSAVFGGVIGSFRGSEQIVFAAVKVPLAMLITLALSVPALHAFSAVLGRPWPMRSVIALALASAGRSSLVLLAFAPVLWLAIDVGLGYHASSVAAWLAYAVAGLAALGVLVRGIGAGRGRWLTAVAFMAVFFAVGGQAAWILRPYLGRPSEREVPFLRAREGSFSDALVKSFRSALTYDDDLRSHGGLRPWEGPWRDGVAPVDDPPADGATVREVPPADGATRREISPADGATRREIPPADGASLDGLDRGAERGDRVKEAQ